LPGVAAGERIVEAAFAFERGGSPGEALSGEAGGPHRIASRLGLGEVRVARAGALPFDEAPGEAGGERDRVRDPASVELHELRGRRGGAEGAEDRTRAKAVGRCRRNEIARAAALHFVAGGERGEERSEERRVGQEWWSQRGTAG